MRYTELLSTGSEREMQSFLAEHPHYLSMALLRDTGHFADRFCVLPQYRLGADYVPDFVIVHPPVSSNHGLAVTLVELEPPDQSAFTKDGKMSQRLNEAYRQVTDWFTWIEDNREFFGKSLMAACKKQRSSFLVDPGMYGRFRDIEPFCDVNATIIVGRRHQMTTADHKRRRTIRNKTLGTIEITHYDRILLGITTYNILHGLDVPSDLVDEAMELGDVDVLRSLATIVSLSEPQVLRLVNHPDPHVRAVLAENPAIPARIIDSFLPTLIDEAGAQDELGLLEALVRSARLSAPHALHLAETPNRRVRAALAANVSITEDVYKKLLGDTDGYVATEARFNCAWASAQDLHAAARDENPWRRARAAKHPKFTDAAELDRLALDPSEIVRDAVGERIRRKN